MTTPAHQTGLKPEEVAALYEQLDKVPQLPQAQQAQAVQAINQQIRRMSPQQQKELQKRQLEKNPPLTPLQVLAVTQNSLIMSFDAVAQRVAANRDLPLDTQIAALQAQAAAAQALVALHGAIAQENAVAQRAPKPTDKQPGQYL